MSRNSRRGLPDPSLQPTSDRSRRLLTAILIRGVTPNRLIQRKLGLSLLLSAAYIAINLWLKFAVTSVSTVERLVSVEQLLIILAALNVLILVLVNPLRVDRVPDRFPPIVQDAFLIGAFLVVGTVISKKSC